MKKLTTISRRSGGRWPATIAPALMLLLLISMTGCASHSVVIPGGETVTVQKATLDNLYSDNEALLAALRYCRKSK